MKDVPAEKALEVMKRIEAEVYQNIRKNIGWFRLTMRTVFKIFRRGPRTEIAHDWLMINGFANMVQENLQSREKIDGSFISALAMIRAYLDLARDERDFAQAWSYVNLATTLLPRVVEEKDLATVTFRMSCHRSKPDDKGKKDAAAQPVNGDADGAAAPAQTPAKEERQAQPLDRNELYRHQLAEAQKWNSRNRIISLRQSLWRFIGACLFTSLVIAISVAEVYFFFPKLFEVNGPFRYIAIALLGFFGGGLSAFLKARKEAINFSNCGLIKTHMILRMLLGAAGSFVVYVLVQWMPITDLTKSIDTNFSVFLSLGIAAGFSERLFINALEKVSSNLKLSGGDNTPNQEG